MNLVSVRVPDPVVGYPRRVGAVPDLLPAVPTTVGQVAPEGFLLRECALSGPVAAAYAHWVGPFIKPVLGTAGGGAPRDVTAGELVAFLARTLPVMSGKSAQVTATLLRSLLRLGNTQVGCRRI